MPQPTLIVHDSFDIRGGGERLILEMANGLQRQGVDTTLMYGWHRKESFEKAHFPQKTIDARYPQTWQERGLRTIFLSLRFVTMRKQVSAYPNRIYSGVCAIFAAPRKRPGAKNIFYCHTPPRNIYDQHAFHAKRHAAWKWAIFNQILNVYRFFYERHVRRMDVIVANSVNIENRIKKYLGRDSVVIYPPIDTSYFKWIAQGDYYLSTARHAPLKRVELIAEAFRNMPDKKLIIASSGEHTEAVHKAAAGAPNIQFTGWTEDKQLLDLLGNCIATVYIPIDEDFGMSPVESMAAGKPIIGVAEGGLLETILDGETGYLTPKEVTPADIMEAVRKLTPEKALSMRPACEARAKKFSAEKFVAAIKALLD